MTCLLLNSLDTLAEIMLEADKSGVACIASKCSQCLSHTKGVLLHCKNSKIVVIFLALLIRNVGLSLSKICRNAIDFISIYFHFNSKTAEAFFKFVTLFSEGCKFAIESVRIYFYFNFKTTAVVFKFANERRRNAIDYQYLFSF